MRSVKAAAIAGIVASAASGMVVATGTTAKSKHGHHKAHPGKARNVILIQGDGMGIAHRELIRLATKGQNGELAMDTMRYAGFVHTDPADPDEPVTDSAAAATAYATGVKSFNGAVAVDVDGKPVTTLLEQARAAGKSTGLVTTSQVTDATPAAFAAHVPDRSDQSEIARQFIESSKPDVILGGGEDFWFPAGDPGSWPDRPAKDPTEASKGTKGNLVHRAEQLGYTYVRNGDELDAAGRGKLLGLFANEEMFEHRNEGQGDSYDPSVPLRAMAAKAIDTLKRDRDGFFLLIEEEGIDEMAHHSNARLTIKSGAALDDTVASVLRFAARTPGTLVLVVGDHETGGLAIENVDEKDEGGAGETAEDGPIPVAKSDLQMTVDWTTGQHTGAATPITAQGPGAQRLGRVQQNTDVHDAVQRAMGLRSAGRR
jgi:alkaline phosphatase